MFLPLCYAASQLEEDGEGFDEEQWEEFAEDGEGEEWEEFAEEEEGEVGEEDQRERDESDVKAAALDSGLESGWSLSGSQTEREKKASEEGKLPRMPSIRTTGSLNLGGRGKTSSEDRRTGKGASRRGRPGGRERGRGSTKPTGKGASRTEEAAGSSRRGRPGGRERGRGSTKPGLSEEDRQRLEEQEAWAKEPDFFADMTPSVAKSSSAKVGSHRTSEKASAVADKMATSVLQYQATEVEVGGDSAAYCSIYSLLLLISHGHRREVPGETGMTSESDTELHFIILYSIISVTSLAGAIYSIISVTSLACAIYSIISVKLLAGAIYSINNQRHCSIYIIISVTSLADLFQILQDVVIILNNYFWTDSHYCATEVKRDVCC